MSIDIPTRPGAALNDPETRKHVEYHITNAEYTRDEKRGVAMKYAFDVDGIVNILANYPWQKFHYKSRRWWKQPLSHEVAFLPFMRVWKVAAFPVLLLDPRSGTEISQVTGTRMRDIPSPSGELLFAGDPHYAGVLNVAMDQGRHIAIVGSLHLALTSPEQYIHIGGKASELARTMSPERTPEAHLGEFPKRYLKTLGPWVADHPGKPPRKGVAGTFTS